MMKIVLASASPRRRELLKQIGLDFEVCESTCREERTTNNPACLVSDLSKQKALDVWNRKKKDMKAEEMPIVIGADTVVALDGMILGKPKDNDDAVNMLLMLSNRTHEVYTGVTIVYEKYGLLKVHTFFEKTEVMVEWLSNKDIASYVYSKEPFDKAGGYGIQGKFAAYIKAIKGDYYNVVGLPVCRLYKELLMCGIRD